jgi:Xaa-Pro aminopeptidase
LDNTDNSIPLKGLSFDREKLLLLMSRKGLDLIIISTRHNIRYLTGGYYYPLYIWDSHTKETQYLSFLGIPQSGLDEAFFVGRPGEKDLLEEEDLWIRECFESMAVGTITAAERAVEVLKNRHFDTARIGIELSSLPADAYELMKKSLPGVEFVDASDIMDSLRAVKTPEEIEIIRKGTILNVQVVESVLKNGRPGESTVEIASEVAEGFRQKGLHFLYSLVCAGPNYFRAASSKRTWENNEILHIDAGGLTKGYVVEICRTGYLGNPSGMANRMFKSCLELEKYVLTELVPGSRASDVQGNADNFLVNHPLGSFGKFIAHGIGLVHHEKPVINLESSEILEAGMVISIEMEFKNAEVGHVKVEDMVLITEKGCEVLSPGSGIWEFSNLGYDGK